MICERRSASARKSSAYARRTRRKQRRGSKNNRMGLIMKTKNLIIINIAAAALFFLLTTVTTIEPYGKIFERKPVFKWTGMPSSYTIMIDDNPDFSTPIIEEVKKKEYTPKNNLELGDHYWKVKGIRNSKVQKFTIVSKVSLKREEESLRNDGNTKLKLNTQLITGAAILDINQTMKIDEKRSKT